MKDFLPDIRFVPLMFFVGVVVYYSLSFAHKPISGMKMIDPNIYVPLIATLLTAFSGLLLTLYTQYRARKDKVEAAFRERKIAIYLEFLETIERLFLAQKPELGLEPVNNAELIISLVKVRTKAVLWGSTDVLKALSDFSKVSEGKTTKILEIMEEIQRAMREDLGLSNDGLEKGFFLKLILTDPNEYERLKKAGL